MNAIERKEVREVYTYLQSFYRRIKARKFPQTVSLKVEDMKKFEQAVVLLEVLMLKKAFKKDIPVQVQSYSSEPGEHQVVLDAIRNH